MADNTMISYNNDYYIQSCNIRVFPCAYRGYYKNTGETTLVFDPEARATTESNFTETFQKLSTNKDSYVVAWVPESADDAGVSIGTLKCVIGGYYFEIYNHSMADFFDDEDTPYHLCIQTVSASLGTSTESDSSRTTKILGSFFPDIDNYLDVLEAASGEYVFTGLCISKDAKGTANLCPFEVGSEYYLVGKATEDKTSQIGKYWLNGTSFVQITEETEESDLPSSGTELYTKITGYRVNPARTPITNVLDMDSGRYSLRMIEDITEQGSNTTQASGDYSVALGRSTSATGECSTAFGDNTEATGKGAFVAGNTTIASATGAVALGNNTTASAQGALAVGNSTTAAKSGSVALGDHTTTNKENQVVIGKYNSTDADQAFIIANGENASSPSNKFTVGYNGNVKAVGNLEITGGTIRANKAGLNTLKLGSSVVSHSGAIEIYGTAAGTSPVFNVVNTGNTTIAGIVNITNTTESTDSTTGALKVTGGIVTQKNLNVGGNTNLSGTLTVAAAKITTLGGNLIVADGKTTTLGGTLTTKEDTTLQGTLTVADGKTTTLGGSLTTKGDTTLQGALSVTGKATSAATVAGDSNTTLTTKKYVDDKCAAAQSAAQTWAQNKINDLDFSEATSAAGDTGKYIQTVSQTDGLISATCRSFETTLNASTDKNAPTSKAVANYVANTVSQLWHTAHVKETSSSENKQTLKALILNAAYPVGSIYMCHSTTNLTTCPIATSLGGTWEPIDAQEDGKPKGGTFLCSANSTSSSIYNRGKEGGFEETQLKAHTHTLTKSSNTNSTTIVSESAGAHTHSLNLEARAHDASTDTGLRSGNPNGGCHQWTFTYTTESGGDHTHDINLSNINVGSAGVDISNTKGTNLPPYVAVYMWKRTA